ncbi:cyclic lactone autoinducer peptide [Cohnella panacarvi]|nr:cyclic lactone autoinducer peptide [Cohnella panacarvi]
MTKKVVGLMAAALGIIAVLFVSTACFGAVGHRPEVPAELLK